MAPAGQIFGPFFGLDFGQNVFNYFCENFPLDSSWTWFLSSLELLLEVCKKLAPGVQIFGLFWAPKYVEIQMFDFFVKEFPLDLHWSCFTCSLELLLEVCWIRASEAQFWASKWVNIRPKWLKMYVFEYFLKNSPLDSHGIEFIRLLQLLFEMYKR